MIPAGKLNSSPELTAGKFAEHDPAAHVISKSAQSAIVFGIALYAVPGTHKVIPASGASGKFIGVAADSFDASDYDQQQYAANDPVGVITRGVVCVPVIEAVTESGPVRVRRDGENAGKFCSAASAGVTALLNGARWAGPSSNGLAPLVLSGSESVVDD